MGAIIFSRIAPILTGVFAAVAFCLKRELTRTRQELRIAQEYSAILWDALQSSAERKRF